MKIKSLFPALLFLFFSVLLTLSASGQQSEIDSLEKALTKEKTDTGRVHTLHLLCWGYRANDPGKALNFAQEALKVSVDINDKLLVAKSFGYLAIVYKNSGKYNKALEYNIKALKVYQERKDSMLMSDSYNNLGNIYIILGKYQDAIANYEASIKLCNELGIPNEAILPLNNMGEVYRKMNDIEKATQCFTRALKLAKESKDESMIVYCLSNMGYIFEMQEKYDSAFSYHYRSMAINKKNKDLYSLAYDYGYISRAYKALEDYDNALEYIDSALQEIEKIDQPHVIAEFHIEKASVYRAAGNPDKALENYKTALKINTELGLKMEMGRCLDSMGTILFHDKRDVTRAIEAFSKELELSHEIQDSAAMASSHFQLGCLFFAGKKYPNAERHLKTAEEISKAYNLTANWSKICRQLSDLYAETGNADLSTHYLELFDSLELADFGKMSLKYQNAKNESQISEMEKDAQMNKLQLYTSIIIALLLFLLSIWIFRFYHQKKKANELLFKQKAVITEKNDRLEAAYTEITRQKEEIEDKNKDIMDSINYAKRLQFALLPLDDDFKKLLPEAFIFYSPKDIVSGDFYFLERVGDRIFFAVADCTGHGVPGAFVSFVGHESLGHAIDDMKLTDPGKILDNVRQQVEKTFDKNEKGEVKDGMDVSLGVWNTSDNSFYFAGAHHTMYLVADTDAGPVLTEIKGDRQSIGAGQGRANFTTVKVEVKKGDLIYFASDGYADQFGGAAGKKFKTAQFKKLLLEIQDKPADVQKELLHKTFIEWKGRYEQVDDVCVVGVRMV